MLSSESVADFKGPRTISATEIDSAPTTWNSAGWSPAGTRLEVTTLDQKLEVRCARYNVQRAQTDLKIFGLRDDASVPSPPGKGFEASSAAIMHDALQVVPEPQSGTLGLAPALHGVGQLNDPAEMNACP